MWYYAQICLISYLRLHQSSLCPEARGFCSHRGPGSWTWRWIGVWQLLGWRWLFMPEGNTWSCRTLLQCFCLTLLCPALLPSPLAHDPRPSHGAPFSEIFPTLNLLFHLESWFEDLPIKTKICKSHVAFWLIFRVVSPESQMIPASKPVLRSRRLLRSAHQLCRAEMLHLLPCSHGGWLLCAGSLGDGL